MSPAAPAITSPEDGDAFDEGEVPAVEGTGLNGATVALAVDGEEVGTAEVVDGEWSIDLPTGLDAGDYELTAVQTIEDVTSSETTVSITVNEEVVEDPGDEDSDEDESEDPGAGEATMTHRCPPCRTGISDGVAPALIAAGLLIAVGAGTHLEAGHRLVGAPPPARQVQVSGCPFIVPAGRSFAPSSRAPQRG